MEERKAKAKAKAEVKASGLLGLCPREEQPEFLAPQLAVEAAVPPEGGEWLHELKLDGYRVQARKDGAAVKLLTRKGLDWTHRMRGVAEAVAGLSAEKATLDGEVVVLGADGNSSFAELQAAFQDETKRAVGADSGRALSYFVFDLLHLDGRSTRGLPLRERKKLLAGYCPRTTGVLRLS